MAKKHKHEEHENHERWLVSYADFITLLFAFFVVMYSVSSVNEGKYRTVSESIKAALNPIVSPPSSPVAISLGDHKPRLLTPDMATAKEYVVRKLRQIVRSIQSAARFEVMNVSVAEYGNGDIVLTVPDSLLFESGEATIKPEGLKFLQAVAEAVQELDRHARVIGHTDNVPIRTAQFPSNWELSATRAVMVVRALSELYGLPSTHLSATGFGDSRPVADNATGEGRTKNRRVEIIILEKGPDPLYPAESQNEVHLAQPDSTDDTDGPFTPEWLSGEPRKTGRNTAVSEIKN